MPLLLPLALMLMQVGPDPMGGRIPGVPEELRDRPPPRKATPDAPKSNALDVCLTTAASEPAKARALAEEWVLRTKGAQRAAGNHCLGVAAGNMADWAAAAAAFLAARDEVAEPRFRARMGALAGSALLAQQEPQAALPVLSQARTDASGDAILGAAIASDRASALVALDRQAEAGEALAEARALAPGDAHVWLLSATLSRRQGDLAGAQQHIQKAATLDPRDPAVGLEAGVIAALGGRNEAARQSFRSVVEAAPDSAEATAARGYLEQLGQ